jgi:hypothetical protein
MIEFFYCDKQFEKFNGFYSDDNVFDRTRLFEKYGIFKDCEEISENILSCIKNAELKNKQDIACFPCTNSLVKKINISIEDIDSAGGYSYKKSIYNDIEKKFDEITIVLTENDIKKYVIMHELQHAKEDLELRKKGKTIEDVLTHYKYSANLYDKSKTNIEKEITNILYYLTSFERNAFINSIYAEMRDNKKNFTNVQNAYDFIKNTEFYKSYENVLYNCNYFINLKDISLKKSVLENVNRKSNLNFKTYKDFRNWLKGKVTEYKNKFEKIIPKIAYSCFEQNMTKIISPPVNLSSHVKRIDEILN